MYYGHTYRESFSYDKIFVIDTETTGLRPRNDEILAIAVVDCDGNELFYHLIKPERRKRWPEAQKINGISPKDVENEKTLMKRYDELAPYFKRGNLIVGYNVDFDIKMLKAGGIRLGEIPTFDVMKAWANAYSGGKWLKLKDAAESRGYVFKSHNALEDARATAFLLRELRNDNQCYSVTEWEKDAEYKKPKPIDQVDYREDIKKRERALIIKELLPLIGLPLTICLMIISAAFLIYIAAFLTLT